ncbi:MAG: hypothetical protein AAGD86_12550, partial [Pseudomonadota bacterium]
MPSPFAHTRWLVALALSLAGCSDADPTGSNADTAADLIITDARVYTLTWADPAIDGTPSAGAPRDADGWHPDASAVACRDGAIVYVGDAAGALALGDSNTRIVDADGA